MTERTAPTLDDVARAAGVSRATASRVINGAVPVSRPATEAVRKAVAMLGYRPNVAARALVTRRVGAVVVFQDITERCRLMDEVASSGQLLKQIFIYSC